MITSSTLPESDLYSDLLLTPTAPLAPPKRCPVNIHVETEDQRTWLLKPDDCLTYFVSTKFWKTYESLTKSHVSQDFAAHFSNITNHFADDFDIFFNEQIITSREWLQTMQQVRTPTMHLRLKRSHSREGSRANDDSSLVVVQGPLTSHWIAIFERLAHVQPSFPLRSAEGGESENLDMVFRNFIEQVDQYQDTKQKFRLNKAAGGVTTKDNLPNLQGGEPTEDHVSVMSRTGSTGSQNNGTASGSGEEQSEDSVSSSYRHCRGSHSSEDGPESRLIKTLSEASTRAVVLAHFGIEFNKEGQEFILADWLNERQLFKVMRMTRKLDTLEALRKITCDGLSLTTVGLLEDDPATHAPQQLPADTIAQPTSDDIVLARACMFDEDVLFQACSNMKSEAFHSKLSSWQSESIAHASIETQYYDEPIPHPDTWTSCELLGCTDPEESDVETGKKQKLKFSAFELFLKLLNGLGLILTTSKLSRCSRELQLAQEKLLSAIFTLITTFHRSLELAAEVPPRAFLNSLARSFAQLFAHLRLLEMHELTMQMVLCDRNATAEGGCAEMLNHISTALILAARALAELEDRSKILQAEVTRRKSLTTNASLAERTQLDYNRVRECCEEVFKITEASDAVRQKRFDEGVDRLEGLGWDKDAAFIVVRNECRWARATHHANLASRMIEASFKAALRADPTKQIQWKAAALPTDVVALLISRLLWRPVLNGQDALDMYNRYTTDLVSLRLQDLLSNENTDATKESSISTGDPNREPLDRIRYLRHELNAFSQLQQEQIDVLEQTMLALLPLDQPQAPAPNDPHPRKVVFATLPKGVQVQNDVVQMLSGMLDGLQSEVGLAFRLLLIFSDPRTRAMLTNK